MRKWKHTINLSHFWGREWTDDNVHEAGKLTAKAIRKSIHDFERGGKWGYELAEIVANFEVVCTIEEAEDINEDNQNYAEETGCEFWELIPLEEYNGLMTQLYDFCDSNDIWVEK